MLADGQKMSLKHVECSHSDVAFLQYTGGTTGVSKGATLTHRNVIANMLQAEAWYQPALAKLKPGEQMITVTALPLYHIFALTCCALLSMRTGGKNLLIPNPRDIPAFVKELAQAQVRRVPCGQHAVQWPAEQRRFQETRFQIADLVARWGHGGTAGRG